MSRKIILAFFDYFHPAIKSGGPSKSSLGFAQNLSSTFCIKVIARDRDKGDPLPFPGVVVDEWNTVENFSVFYASSNGLKRFYFSKARQGLFDHYYFNSIFSVWYSILPLLLIRLRILPLKPIVIAPRGELARSALGHNSLIKRIYLIILRWFILRKGIRFHATGSHEVKDIENEMGKTSDISLIPNLRPRTVLQKYSPAEKETNSLRVIFLSRITPVKNLEFVVDVLAAANRRILLDIFGYVDDEEYFQKCRTLIAKRKLNNVCYKGAVSPDDVNTLFQNYHLLFLPSKGENFGHVIFEAFAASRPVLISDQTPWRGLIDLNAGADLSLVRQEEFVSWLNSLYEMSSSEFEKLCKGSYLLAQKYYTNDKSAAYEKLFSGVQTNSF